MATTLLFSFVCDAKEINGFELDDALIPPSQIFHGGPGKDGIPAIDRPTFVKARDADFLMGEDRILGIEIRGISKAYPISILNWHEIVNDSFGEQFFTITYCPLCGTGVAFDSTIIGKKHSFGVSGLLYNSDVLLYDRETESLWSQLLSRAVTGTYKGMKLSMLPVLHTTWSDWKRHHPSTLVLSDDTGYWRDYKKDPYSGYDKSEHLVFLVFNRAPARYHPKEKVLGLGFGESYRAYPFIELNKYADSTDKDNTRDVISFTDTVNDQVFTIRWNRKAQSGTITSEKGLVMPIVQSYWFAWYTFHTETEVFIAK